MWREILGLEKKPNNLVELIVPRRSFGDVVLPAETRQQLYEALTQIEKHRLIFNQWGLGERHPTGMGLAFNFAGPPGTGKTICAEAVAYALGRRLLTVRYAELESCWAGETGKNIRIAFREAREQEAVLFFDEADSVAARRFSNIQIGYERESNQAVNILLKELEEHEGVVIFATNMASNFDPAFERRIRTHILFRIPGVEDRERIWKLQVHPNKTPLGSDVDFRQLAERFEVAGGDIRNAVLKAAQIAAAEEGPDETKRILQRHFLTAIEQVLSGKRVMQQSVADPCPAEYPLQQTMEAAEKRLEALDSDLGACRTELELLGEAQAGLAARLEEREVAVAARLEEVGSETAALRRQAEELTGSLAGLRSDLVRAAEAQESAIQVWRGEQENASRGLLDQLRAVGERLEAQEALLGRATLIGLPRWATAVVAVLLLALGALGGWLLPHP